MATPVGSARAVVHRPERAGSRATGTLVLGHGAGRGIDAVDLVAVTGAVVAAGWNAVLVEQPWRVAGRTVAAPPRTLDAAWLAVVADLVADPSAGLRRGRLVLAGRSAGARVACRTALALDASAVVCLAFPLHPPGRPERSRADELSGCGVPALVVQGRRDAFGTPDEVRAAVPGAQVVAVDGDHGLKADVDAVAAAVVAWLLA